MNEDLAWQLAISLGIIMVAAQVAQVWKFISSKLVAGVSSWFFRLWLVGDACLVVGYGGGLMLMVAGLRVALDMVLVVQWWWYNGALLAVPLPSLVMVTSLFVQGASAFPVGAETTVSPQLAAATAASCFFVLSWVIQIMHQTQLQLVSDILARFVSLLVIGTVLYLMAVAVGFPLPLPLTIVFGVCLGLELVTVHQMWTLDSYVVPPQAVLLDTLDWYPFEVADHSPLETTLLLMPAKAVWIARRQLMINYTTSPPPRHYVILLNSLSVEPRLHTIPIGGRAGVPHDTTLLPLLVGTYSQVLKKMKYEKIPFSPRDFLSDEYMTLTNKSL